MFKNFVGLASALVLLTGCSQSSPAPQPKLTPKPSYSLPSDCKIDELVALDSKYEVFDQTAEGATDTRDCAIGVANSDVGIFFGYSARTEAEWQSVITKLKSEGYSQWDAAYAGSDVWRLETGNAEEGANCSLSGHIDEISFSVTEPWTTCDDEWNKELVGYILDHAKKNA